MLSDFPQDAWHVRRLPRKVISIGVEEVDERAFLFIKEHGADAHRLFLGPVGVNADFLDILRRFEGIRGALGVDSILDDLLSVVSQLFRSYGRHRALVTLHIAQVRALE